MDYSPRNLALTRPAGQSVFEFLIEGRDEVGAFASIVKLFADHNIDIRSINAESNPNTKENLFLVVAFCDFSKADCTVEQFEKELKGLGFITKVMSADMKGKLFDQFIFPTRIMNDKRVIVFRVGPLLNIEKSLVKHFGSAGEAIMFEEGRSYADKVVDQYKEALPGANTESLLENIRDGLRATGWGVFDFRRVGKDFEVIVKDPPFDESTDYKESRFYLGVASKVMEKVFGGSLSVSDSHLDPDGRRLAFRLVAK